MQEISTFSSYTEVIMLRFLKRFITKVTPDTIASIDESCSHVKLDNHYIYGFRDKLTHLAFKYKLVLKHIINKTDLSEGYM